MADLPAGALLWPPKVLRPLSILPNPVPFTRSGGRSLGGLERVTKTDHGWWSIVFRGVELGEPGQRRSWNRIRTKLGGKVGLIAVPAWSFDAMPRAVGTTGGAYLTTHSDGTPHSDGSRYSQPSILMQMASAAGIGDTVVSLRAVYNVSDLAGIRFSHNHALYETGDPLSIDGDVWTVEIFPAVRAPIPSDAWLDVDMPTCLVHLAEDRGMDVSFSRGGHDRADVAWVEATDYWNDLAIA